MEVSESQIWIFKDHLKQLNLTKEAVRELIVDIKGKVNVNLRTYLVVKRSADVLLSVLSLVIALPLMIIIGVLIRIDSKGPVIYKQIRAGLNGRPFTIYKFRSMREKEETEQIDQTDNDRVTKIGRLIRRTSVDELPQLLNIIKGDMSIVGPRPLLVEYLPLYNDRQRRRHEVRPGLTGLAQIKGRNAITWQDRLEYDVIYVDNMTLFKDISIILATVIKVIKREGINSGEYATMEPFTGNISSTREKE